MEMVENNAFEEEYIEELTNAICVFLRIKRPKLTSVTLTDRVCEIVVAKLCCLLDIRCAYNYKNDSFYFFSMLVGDALVDRLGYKIEVAPYFFKWFKCNGVNLSDEVKNVINEFPIGEAFIKCFDMLDDLRCKVKELKLNKYN